MAKNRDIINESLTEYIRELIAPKEITPTACSRALRRAYRYGSIRILTSLEKALLKVASLTKIKRFISPKIKEKLKKIIIKIETYSPRGYLMILGIKRAYEISSIYKNEKDMYIIKFSQQFNKSYISYLGRSIFETLNYFVMWRM